MNPEVQATIILFVILYVITAITLFFDEVLRRVQETDSVKKRGQTGIEALGELLFVSLYRTTYIYFGVFRFLPYVVRWLFVKK
jgi:hypothetical protein